MGTLPRSRNMTYQTTALRTQAELTAFRAAAIQAYLRGNKSFALLAEDVIPGWDE